jgi:hypothetical protein
MLFDHLRGLIIAIPAKAFSWPVTASVTTSQSLARASFGGAAHDSASPLDLASSLLGAAEVEIGADQRRG